MWIPSIDLYFGIARAAMSPLICEGLSADQILGVRPLGETCSLQTGELCLYAVYSLLGLQKGDRTSFATLLVAGGR